METSPHRSATDIAPSEGLPDDELRIAISFKSMESGLGLTKFEGRPSSTSIGRFAPDSIVVDRAVEALHRLGFAVTGKGQLTLSVRGSRKLFESTFGTKLSVFRLSRHLRASCHEFYFPADGAPWKPDPTLAALIDEAYIQWPHLYMGPTSSPARRPRHAGTAPRRVKPGAAVPPIVDYFHLDVLKDVPRLLGATPVHDAKGTGKGVRVVMVDTGFAHSHPWFVEHGFASTVVLASGATDRTTDPVGHGTGESANLFAVAPGVTLIGVKVGNDANPAAGASLLEGFHEALQHSPHIISMSMGYDLSTNGKPMSQLPNSLKALEAEIQAAVASGVIVVVAAGNGQYSFPAMMPEVLSVGGVYADAKGALQASDTASAFPSAIYSGRSVPDFCGLVGTRKNPHYIMLPVQAGSELDVSNAATDGTRADDAWALFSGTSAAAPQLAGVSALLVEKRPGLKPAEAKAALVRTARDVTAGRASAQTDVKGVGIAAGTGRDGATGSGLVDAFGAWKQL